MSTIGRFQNAAILLSMFGFISLWNIPHTIAARYLLAGLLLIIVVVSNPDWKLFFRSNLILLGLFAYLIIHLLFFSIDFDSALGNFTSEWLKFILYSVVGAGSGLLILKNRSRTLLLFLAIAFATPLLIHLVLSIPEGLSRGGIPWGYFGLSGTKSVTGTHGDLAYAAIPATIFSSVFLLYQAISKFEKALALFLITACIASPLIATSRAGTATVLILLLFVFLVDLAIKFRSKVGAKGPIIGLLAIVLVLIAVAKFGAAADPTRWTGVTSRVEMGMRGDSLEIICNGVGVLRESLEAEGQVITPEILQALTSIQERQDGARVVTARAALQLARANPMGIDQSKDAYAIAISRICEPAIFLRNAHNGWINTALAIGIPGAILYLLVLLNFAALGIRNIKENDQLRPFAVALFVTSTIWILRAFIDATQRDQMLEMQIFTVTFLYGFIASSKKLASDTPVSNQAGSG